MLKSISVMMGSIIYWNNCRQSKQKPFTIQEQDPSKEIMELTKSWNKFLKSRIEEDQKNLQSKENLILHC